MDDELRQRIENADTIAALDKLRMDIVSSKDRTLLKLWQDKFWERKKKYSFEELRQYGIQERIDVLRSLPQDTICASGLLINSPTIVSEWVAGSVVNNEIRRLTALKDRSQS